jgi:hypothetical protein
MHTSYDFFCIKSKYRCHKFKLSLSLSAPHACERNRTLAEKAGLDQSHFAQAIFSSKWSSPDS